MNSYLTGASYQSSKVHCTVFKLKTCSGLQCVCVLSIQEIDWELIKGINKKSDLENIMNNGIFKKFY